MDIENGVGLSVRIISGLSMFLYFLIFFIICKNKSNLSQVIKIQLNITCIMHSGSFLFPKMESPRIIYLLEAALNMFGEFSKIAISTTITLISRLNFLESPKAEKRKKYYIAASIIFTWVIPSTATILSMFYGRILLGKK